MFLWIFNIFVLFKNSSLSVDVLHDVFKNLLISHLADLKLLTFEHEVVNLACKVVLVLEVLLALLSQLVGLQVLHMHLAESSKKHVFALRCIPVTITHLFLDSI